MRDTLRVYKIHLEDKVKRTFSVEAPIIQWMARWAAMALSRFKVGKDRRTAYERQRGKRCKVEVVPFGEKVWFRQLDHEDGKKRSLQTKWQEGVWLGQCRESNETWVGRGGVAVRAWFVMDLGDIQFQKDP